jgi:ABC-2 type transport system ATP-binding protein
MFMSDVILQTHNLTKHYGDVVAVREVNLAVSQGEVFGFLGPNGAGKTTTIGMALGLIHATAGGLELFGQPVSPDRTGPLRQVGSLVGTPALLPYLSGRDNLRLLARLHPNVDKQRIEEVLALVDMTEAAGRKTKGYSTGMKQRLGLAAALLHRPSLVMLDEPTNGLDPAGMRDVRNLLRSLADSGITVFLSSHLLHEVEQVCDRIAVINQGRIVTQGLVRELLAQREQVVRVRVPSPAEAQRVLEGVPGVGRMQSNGNYIEISGLPSETIVAALTSNGIVPGEVAVQKSDLESLFLSLTTGQDA